MDTECSVYVIETCAGKVCIATSIKKKRQEMTGTFEISKKKKKKFPEVFENRNSEDKPIEKFNEQV